MMYRMQPLPYLVAGGNAQEGMCDWVATLTPQVPINV